MKTVLLTGATGFLGSHLLEALLLRGYRVVVLTRFNSDTRRISRFLGRIERYSADPAKIKNAFAEQKIDIVIHTACNYGRKGEPLNEVLDTNLIFSLQLLQIAIEHNVSTFINTDTILPRNMNAYTTSKKQFVDWLFLLCNRIQVVNFRPDFMYGPGDSDDKLVPWIIGELKGHAKRIPLTRGEQLRNFIYVSDVASAYMAAIKNTGELKSFTELDVGSGISTTIRDFVEALSFSYQQRDEESNTTLDFGALPYRPREAMTVTLDMSGLEKLGWRSCVSRSAGIDKLMEETL